MGVFDMVAMAQYLVRHSPFMVRFQDGSESTDVLDLGEQFKPYTFFRVKDYVEKTL